ncbi:hypothetical protein [Actinoplanes sp. G11-F43]|uniref:hypothetical protein n=1 Tax=Actinoplanes sp. G11-F43 TaxID=3424130 RepID=UPI003D34D8DC
MGTDEGTANVPNAMISLWMPDEGRQAFVGAFTEKQTELVMDVSYDPPEGSFRYAAVVRRVEDGPVTWPVIEAVTIRVKDGVPFGDAPIDRKAMDDLPLAELVRNAFDALHWDLEKWASAIGRFPPPRRGEGYPEEHYKQIAGAYRAAEAAGVPPRAFIMKTWQMSGAEVSRWISRARDLGFLAAPRKSAGGRPRRTAEDRP